MYLPIDQIAPAVPPVVFRAKPKRDHADILRQLDRERYDSDLQRVADAKTRPGYKADRLGELVQRAFAKLTCGSGNPSPVEVAHEMPEWLRETRYPHLRLASNVMPRDRQARLDDVEFPRQRLKPDEFAQFLHVRDELAMLQQFPGTIVLCGSYGPGKTRLASALVNAFCDAGRPAFYTTALNYYRMLASTFDKPGKTVDDLYARLSGKLRPGGYELLVIDEVEVQPGKDWHRNELRDLINSRYGHEKATVLITNLSPEEINRASGAVEYFNAAIRSRTGHVGKILPCNWRSLREPQWPMRIGPRLAEKAG
jgi:DNA replication protein DnaC